MQNDQFQQAVVSCRLAIDKGSLKNVSSVCNIPGIALYKLKQYPAALEAFRFADDDPDSRQESLRWQKHILELVER